VIKVEKHDDESNESLTRRFTRKVRSSGLLNQKKSKQFHARKPSKRAVRESAIRRAERKEEVEYLIKTGRLEPTPAFGPRNRKPRS
jgi:ribosomal protein S21